MGKDITYKIPIKCLTTELPIFTCITEKVRQSIVNYAKSHSIGNVRIYMGRFYTDQEYEQRRQRILNTPLP